MKPPPILTKVEIIERSIRCFKLGLFSFLPGVGIPLIVLAVFECNRVNRGLGSKWNPAERFLFWGGQLASYAIVPNAVLVLWIIGTTCFNI